MFTPRTLAKWMQPSIAEAVVFFLYPYYHYFTFIIIFAFEKIY